LRGEHIAERRKRLPVGMWECRDAGVEFRELDVEVSYRAETLADPTEFVTDLNGLCWEHIGKERKCCAKPATCNAHVVQLLRVVPEPSTRLARAQLREVLPKHCKRDCSDRHRAIDLGRSEPFSLGRP
jgi:hypothetical protein